jgi:DNA polymerase II small subunit/DNA polymerase delta subunit B
MSQEVENELKQGAPIDEVKQYSQAEVEKMLQEETAGLKNKVDELLGKTVTASQKAREAEEKLSREAEQRAKEQNDYKSLFESSKQKTEEFEQKYTELKNGILQEKVNTTAMSISTELADGNNAKILSEFVKRRITYNDGQMIVLDEAGNPTVSTIGDLKKEFIASGMFDSLLRQSKASGGSASTPSGRGINGKVDLLNMSRQEKLEYFRNKR